MFVKITVQCDGTQSPRWYKTDEVFEMVHEGGNFYRVTESGGGHAGKTISMDDCDVLVVCVESFKYGVRQINKGDEYWAYQDNRERKYVLRRDGEMRIELEPEVARMQFKVVE